MKRLLVYSHDTYGLGNIRRMLAISEHLCAVHKDLSILIVTGSPMLHAFRITARIDYVKLPCLTRTIEGDYQVKSLGLGYEATMAMRRQILEAAVSRFDPDLILVDKKPFGVDEELRPALDRIAESTRRPKLVLLLRDILDDPETTCRIWSKNDYYQAIESYFDSVLVLGCQEVFDLPTEYRFPPATTALVDFCGYLGRPTAGSPQAGSPQAGSPQAGSPQAGVGSEVGTAVRAGLAIDSDTPLVLVTPGGGEDGAVVVETYLSAVAGLSYPGFASVVVTGPEMGESARRGVFESCGGRSDVRILEFTSEMAELQTAADLVVCMGGYNTLCEVLGAGRSTVVIPRVRPVQEQLIRARLLAERGLVTMIHPDELTPARLMAAVRRGLADDVSSRSSRRSQALDMGGVERVEKHLAGLIGDG